MRTSILSRSVIAAASSLAIGSAVLVAAPANAAELSAAATPAGVTRETVLAAAAGLRQSTDATYPTKAVRNIANRSCGVDADSGEATTDVEAIFLTPAGHADGIAFVAHIRNLVNDAERVCVGAAVAAAASGFQLTGTGSLTVTTEEDDGPIILEGAVSAAVGPSTVTSVLTGDVTTTVFNLPQGEEIDNISFSANGSSVFTQKITTSTKVPDQKSAKQKKAAKKAYSKALKAAKKSYDKALEKAGGSKTKKAAAKKAYSKKKATAKARYKYAIANYKIVKKTTTQTDSRPFALTIPVL